MPGNAAAQEAWAEALSIAGDPIWNAWDLVCRRIEYPAGPYFDFHHETAFLRGWNAPFLAWLPRRTRERRFEFWQFPFETLGYEIGDCEDTSILLCSMLRNQLLPSEAYVAVGWYDIWGHAWVSLPFAGEHFVLETTFDAAPHVPPYTVLEGGPYKPLVYFNDVEVIEVSGGFAELEGARRDELQKLGQIRRDYSAVGGNGMKVAETFMPMTGVPLGQLTEVNPLFVKGLCYWPTQVKSDEPFLPKWEIHNNSEIAGNVAIAFVWEGTFYIFWEGPMAAWEQGTLSFYDPDTGEEKPITIQEWLSFFDAEPLSDTRTIDILFWVGYMVGPTSFVGTDSWELATYVEVVAGTNWMPWAIGGGVALVGLGLVMTRK